MKNYTPFLFLIFLLFCSPVVAQTTPDAELLRMAAETLNSSANCDSAMALVQSMSAAGKNSAAYNATMARIYECRKNDEYALIYYGKALAANPGDADVKARIAVLEKADSLKNAGAANKNADNSRSIRKPKHLRTNVEDGYYLVSMGYSSMTGGQKAIERHGIDLSFSVGMPVIDQKFIFDFTPTLGTVFSENTKWRSIPQYKNYPNPDGLGIGLLMGLEASLNYMLVNNHYHTLAAGLAPGVQVLAFDYHIQKADGSVGQGSSTLPVIGARLAYYMGRKLYLCAEYQHFGFRQLRATIDTQAPTVPVNLDLVRIDLGIRIGEF